MYGWYDLVGKRKGVETDMTYKQLAKEIDLLTEEQKNMDVTVYVRGDDEFYPVTDNILFSDTEIDVLDENHPYLRI